MQQVIQEIHSDPSIRVTISEQQDSIGQIIQEIYRLREEIAKVRLTLKQGFILIDETCTKHASVLEGLQSFAGSQVGTNQKVQETMIRMSGQLLLVQQRTRELQRDTSLDWRIQETEHDLMKLQESTRSSSQNDQTLTKLVKEVQEVQQSPLWHELQTTAAELRQLKDKFLPVMKDVESQLTMLEANPIAVQAYSPLTDEQVFQLKEKLLPVMKDREKTGGVQRRVDNLEAWVRSYTGGVPINALGFTTRELEGRLLKRIESIEMQVMQINTQELPVPAW